MVLRRSRNKLILYIGNGTVGDFHPVPISTKVIIIGIQNGSLGHLQAKVKRLYMKLDVIKFDVSLMTGWDWSSWSPRIYRRRRTKSKCFSESPEEQKRPFSFLFHPFLPPFFREKMERLDQEDLLVKVIIPSEYFHRELFALNVTFPPS